MSETKAPQPGLHPVDGVEIIVLVDDVVDMMSSVQVAGAERTWWLKRGQRDTFETLPLAEHGFAALVTVFDAGQRHTLLFDAGFSGQVALHNAGCFGFDWGSVEAAALSHGHADHAGGMEMLLRRIGRPALPLLAHDDTFVQRGHRGRDGSVSTSTPPADPAGLADAGAAVTCHREPYFLFDGGLGVLGEIPRVVPFEEGTVGQMRQAGDGWADDPWTWDDRSVVVCVRGEGLVVVSGCAHAGIVNTVLHARDVAGEKRVRAVAGGFHLAGKRFEPRIDATVAELRALAPALLVPMHCTGPRAIHAMCQAMPAETLPAGALLRLRLGQVS